MLFITFEGPEGSGKTSVLNELKTKFANDGIEIISAREPGGSVISEAIREIILHKDSTLMDPWTEVLLYLAARRQHLVEKIFPQINSNKVIICDRFSDSTLAYQGYGRKLDIKKIITIQNIIFDNFQPQLTILFDIDPKISLKRIQTRHDSENDRLDEENLTFHELVYQGYQEIAKNNQTRIKIIDANQDFTLVVKDVYDIIKKFISSNN